MASRRRGSARTRVTRDGRPPGGGARVWRGFLLLAGSGAAEAHPLGNFTINLYDGLIVRADGIDVDYVVDMAEIPAFEEKPAIDANGDGTLDPTETASLRRPYLRSARERRSRVTVANAARPDPHSGRPARSRSRRAPAACRRCGSSARCTARRSSAGAAVSYADGNFAGRIGWHEVTVVGDRLAVLDSDAPAQSVSTRLTAYPADLLQSPLDQRTASFRVGGPTSIFGGGSGHRRDQRRSRGLRRPCSTNAFTGLVTTGGSTPLLWMLALATAFAIGGIHALGPGHGKTLMAAYLVGSDARPRQVVAVGAAVSVMHTASVVVLGVAVLLAGRAFTPEVAYRWTTIASGALVAGLGVYLLVTRTPERAARTGARHRAHART